ncbi:MAG: hypothetical protein FD123_1546 [Bacteroidetes bacterium]|nr:MAG: hypothetical protein FD123_1546 [Bacteroidota bacterium]
MKITVLIIFSSYILTIVNAQTFNLTVNNGYGSGTYSAGDTVHVWSLEYDSTKFFKAWSGDTSFLSLPNEWHTFLVMPAQNITVTANIQTVTPFTFNYEQIQGMTNLKNVYWHFPTSMKGVIYYLHGTGGNAANWTTKTEMRNFINAAVADTFGVIITECEETTVSTDLNGDGKIRWFTYPVDSIANVDYVNIKAITDTMINRGLFNYSLPRFSVGMSAGGSFSSTLSFLYNYKSAAIYCAEGQDTVFTMSSVPVIWCMQQNDTTLGIAGNSNSYLNYQELSGNSICASHNMHYKFPIFPEYFARIIGIPVSLSQSIFNELAVNGQIQAGNYANQASIIVNDITTNPTNYPVVLSLSFDSQQQLVNEIMAANAEHEFYTDFASSTIAFFNSGCSSAIIGLSEIPDENIIPIFPNPFSNNINIVVHDNLLYKVTCFDLAGQLVFSKNVPESTSINFSFLPAGVYLFVLENDHKSIYHKIIKQ